MDDYNKKERSDEEIENLTRIAKKLLQDHEDSLEKDLATRRTHEEQVGLLRKQASKDIKNSEDIKNERDKRIASIEEYKNKSKTLVNRAAIIAKSIAGNLSDRFENLEEENLRSIEQIEQIEQDPELKPIFYEEAFNGLQSLLRLIGEDPHRDGLQNTPMRMIKAFVEMTSGYEDDPAEILSTTFDITYDQIVLLKNIHFVSVCEHHSSPIQGVAHVGYLPGEKVVGLSKLARLVDCFAKRLQVQERMTNQIAEAIMEHLEAKGVGVIVKAQHGCMTCRGVKKDGAEMITSAMYGAMRDNQTTRDEFLKLCMF